MDGMGAQSGGWRSAVLELQSQTLLPSEVAQRYRTRFLSQFAQNLQKMNLNFISFCAKNDRSKNLGLFARGKFNEQKR
jgi:hypothetical protein